MKLKASFSPESLSNLHLLVLDILFGSLTPAAALWLRVESVYAFLEYFRPVMVFASVGVVWKLFSFRAFGLYSQQWRYASVEEGIDLAKAAGTAMLIGLAAFYLVLRPSRLIPPDFPRSIPLIDGVLTLFCAGGMRFAVRLAHTLQASPQQTVNTQRVLIAGAGDAGSMTVKEMIRNPQLGLVPAGFVDDDPAKAGQYIHGVKVLGKLADIPGIVARQGIKQVIIAMPKETGGVIRSVVQTCRLANVDSRTIPGVYELLDGRVSVSQIREVQIEDILRRGVVKNETKGLDHLFRDTCVMITGAGGSIGRELCRQICSFHPSDIVLLGHGENSIFEIAAELRAQSTSGMALGRIHAVIADIRDRQRVSHALQTFRPGIVLHAAAHKHVGLMESNVADAVTNNVLGTQTLVDLALDSGVERFVMISSDKAVNPTSTMGVTKRVAELIVQEAAFQSGRAFITVRFGNVLGSRGSILPIFKGQIASGGPVTVTHPGATRFFMTIPEAVQLVLQATMLGCGGEVFVLDMGEPVRIYDLARDLIRLSGLVEGKDIKIEYTGLQPGEKLTEELFYGWERTEHSLHEKIFVCTNGMSRDLQLSPSLSGGGNMAILPDETARFTQLRLEARKLVEAAQEERIADVIDILRDIVPEYRPGREQPEKAGQTEIRSQTQVDHVP
ncbi:MAG TPA: nucleoside-diphosphate sugar epimerase/dehydratase [Bacteroidota bacterium]|nr:nucleoside-diphosphate sugar epimerase/dehydratase [Bacteroidota bacterium]